MLLVVYPRPLGFSLGTDHCQYKSHVRPSLSTRTMESGAIPAIVLPSGPVHKRFKLALYHLAIKWGAPRFEQSDHDTWSIVMGHFERFEFELKTDRNFTAKHVFLGECVEVKRVLPCRHQCVLLEKIPGRIENAVTALAKKSQKIKKN